MILATTQIHLMTRLLDNLQNKELYRDEEWSVEIQDNKSTRRVDADIDRNFLGLVQHIRLAFFSTHPEVGIVEYFLEPGGFNTANEFEDWVVHTFGIAEEWLKDAWETYEKT